MVSPFPPSRMRAWIIAIFLIFTVLGVSWGSWLSRFPSLRDGLGLSLAEMSLLALCPALGSVVGLLFAGRIIGRSGTKTALAIWVTTMFVAMPTAIWLLFAGWLPAAVAALFVYGFAFSTSDVAANVNGTLAERVGRTPRMALMHAGYSLGSVASITFGAFAERIQLDVFIHLASVQVVVFVTTIIALRRIVASDPYAAPPTPTSEAAASATEPRERAPERKYTPWKDPRVLLVGLVTLAGSLTEGVASDWLPLTLIDEYGTDNQNGVLALTLMYTGSVSMRLIGDRLLARFGRVAILRTTLMIGAIGVLAVSLSPVVWVAYVGAFLWGIGASLAFPIGISASGDRPETATQDVATVSAIAYAAYVAGPVVFGYLGDHIGLRIAFFLLVAVQIAGAILSTHAAEPGRRARRSSE